MNSRKPPVSMHQQGAVLLMTMILLLMMTLFAVSSANISNLGLKIVANIQQQKGVEDSAMAAIEQVISTSTAFNLTPAAQTIAVGGNNVTISAPVCLYSRTATGYSATWGLAPEENTWEVVASATDANSGSTVTIHQGIQIRMLAGNCP
jgi:Tfp pilus assembly protein PilX